MPANLDERMKEITERLEQGVQEIFTSERYMEYLKTMSQFTHYSFNNTVLIAMQRPDATLVAGYQAWQKKFNRHVKRGEKGIQIISPAPIRERYETEKVDPETQQPVLGADGLPEMEEKEHIIPRFKVATVFDVSQTDGEPLPELMDGNLTAGVENYGNFMAAITAVSPVPVRFDEVASGANGYYSNTDKEIVIQSGMSESQTMKTAVHEVTHALLHDRDRMREQGIQKDRMTMELESESVAFTVCQYFGLDTSDYSFPYIASWSDNLEMAALRSSMDTIRRTAGQFISDMEEQLKMMQLMEQEAARELPDSQISIAQMHEYGYYGDDMLPLTRQRALEMHRIGEKVYCLNPDGTASDYASREQVMEHTGIFGIRKEDWEYLQSMEEDELTDSAYLHPPLVPLAKEDALHYYDAGETIYLITSRPLPVPVHEREEIERGEDEFQIAVDGLEKMRRLETGMEAHPEIQGLREAKLLLDEENQYGIYQIRRGSPAEYYQFMNYDFVQSHGYRVDHDDYTLVYSGTLYPADTLDGLFERFNIDHPEDFTGHSLSVSDIVVLNRDGTVKAFYVDSVGFKELPEFLPQLGQEIDRSGQITMESTGVEVDGHFGTWHPVEMREVNGLPLFLMEHDEYGSSVAKVIVDQDGQLFAQDLWNGFDAGAMEAVAECFVDVKQPVTPELLFGGRYLPERAGEMEETEGPPYLLYDKLTAKHYEQDGAVWESHNLQEAEQMAALLNREYEAESGRDTHLRTENSESHIAVYRQGGTYAREHGQIEMWRASRRENVACRDAIETAVRENFDGMHLNTGAAKPVIEQFGVERTAYVLASTLQMKDWDGRFSRDNIEWAKAIHSVPDIDGFGTDRRYEFAVNSHPAVLDGFVTLVRQELAERAKEQEKAVEMEAAYQIGDRYFFIQASEEGFDYTFYDAAFHGLDGGRYGTDEKTIGEAAEELLSGEGLRMEDASVIDSETFLEKVHLAEQAEMEEQHPLTAESVTGLKGRSHEYDAGTRETIYIFDCKVDGIPAVLTYTEGHTETFRSPLYSRGDIEDTFSIHTDGDDIWNRMPESELLKLSSRLQGEAEAFLVQEEIANADSIPALKDVEYGMMEWENSSLTDAQRQQIWDAMGSRAATLIEAMTTDAQDAGQMQDVRDSLAAVSHMIEEGQLDRLQNAIEARSHEFAAVTGKTLPLISDSTQPEKGLNGMSRAAVEETVLCFAQAEIDRMGLTDEVKLLGVRVYGSRSRAGLYDADSDLDVALSYSGEIREDSFFNVLHEAGLEIAGIPVDINPVSLERTGNLSDYLEQSEKYLDSKEAERLAAEIDAFMYDYDTYSYRDSFDDRESGAAEALASIQSGEDADIRKFFTELIEEPESCEDIETAKNLLSRLEHRHDPQVPIYEAGAREPQITFYVAECMEFPVLGEYQDGLTLQEAFKKYEEIPVGRMNGIKGVGFCLEDRNGVSSEFPLIEQGHIDSDAINSNPEYRDSPLVQQALADAQAYLDERQQPQRRDVAPTAVETEDETLPEAAEEMATPELPKQPGAAPENVTKGDVSRAGASKKDSVLKALRERQAKLKAQEAEQPKQGIQAHKKGEQEL